MGAGDSSAPVGGDNGTPPDTGAGTSGGSGKGVNWGKIVAEAVKWIIENWDTIKVWIQNLFGHNPHNDPDTWNDAGEGVHDWDWPQAYLDWARQQWADVDGHNVRLYLSSVPMAKLGHAVWHVQALGFSRFPVWWDHEEGYRFFIPMEMVKKWITGMGGDPDLTIALARSRRAPWKDGSKWRTASGAFYPNDTPSPLGWGNSQPITDISWINLSDIVPAGGSADGSGDPVSPNGSGGSDGSDGSDGSGGWSGGSDVGRTPTVSKAGVGTIGAVLLALFLGGKLMGKK